MTATNKTSTTAPTAAPKASQLCAEFREARMRGTPWCIVDTTDWRATMTTLLGVRKNGETTPPAACLFTVVDGTVSPIRSPLGAVLSGTVSGMPTDILQTPPHLHLKASMEMLPEDGIYFWVVPSNDLLRDPFVAQAMSDLRDVYKTNGRMLVIMGLNPQVSEFVREDVPTLTDPLPTLEELQVIATEAVRDICKSTAPDSEIQAAARACLGLTRFAAEEAICRKTRRTQINLADLGKTQAAVIEQSSGKALTFERETWTFDEVGGLESFKGFMGKLFGGPRRPNLVVRVDEIDKSITAASSGTVSDNTGVSQDILKCLLTGLEENKWMGLLAVGGPGTGKSLASICTGNTFGAKTLALDLGAVKGSLVGESEQKIRRTLDIIKTVGGQDVLFMATCNRMDTLPAELQRRFWLGTWFWDVPSQEERAQIWKIQRARFQINAQDVQPNDDGWTGSDIRNCCQMAYITADTLTGAAERITLVGRASKPLIDSLRDLAERSDFRSANLPGAYRKPQQRVATRKISS
jgi:SpoVK/Ycf46/Vps4 family AAA+-type ATPase